MFKNSQDKLDDNAKPTCSWTTKSSILTAFINKVGDPA